MGVKVREKPKGSGVWWIFIDHEGKRKAKKIGKDKKLANEVAKKVEAKLVLGDFDLDEKEDKEKKITLKEYVNGWKDDSGYHVGWFEKQAKLALKRSTCRSYRSVLDQHILPALGNRALTELTPRITADFLASKINEGLRSNTAKNIKNCLSSVLSYACQPDGYIETRCSSFFGVIRQTVFG